MVYLDPEECVKLYFSFAFVIIVVIISAISASAQADTVIGQITSSNAETFIGGISGDGRFVVFESRGDLATENPRNADGNLEIFLFDYAQRRIFQITDTKAVLFDNKLPGTFDNVRVDIVNTRPVISNDGKWIAFSSNATTSTPAAPDSTNPGNFDGNAFTTPTPTPSPTASPTPTPSPSPSPTATPDNNVLIHDGNLEMWLYEIPAYAPVANLSTGDELPLTNLSGGNFIRVTNTDPSQLPRAGSPTSGAFVADDNHDASISDDGGSIAFVSTRDLVPSVGNPGPPSPPPPPREDNDEIFTYIRGTATLQQITKTPRGTISNPIYNKNVTIAGNGTRVVFASTGDSPAVNSAVSPPVNLSCGSTNPAASRNEEIFYVDLNAGGAAAACKQITTTTPTNPGDPVNILDLGRRMSRDGRYIAFDSHADLTNENSGTNFTSFSLFLYDTTTSTYKRIGPRSDADTGAPGGDIAHYPGFTDNDANGTPATLVLETRENIKSDGTIPATAADGLNPDVARPTQIYYLPISASPLFFTRITKFPAPTAFLASTQPITSNSIKRLVFSLGLTELGLGNADLLPEAFYLLKPDVITNATAHFNFATGATRIPVSPTAVPTPTPGPTPSPTPSPSPSATPVPSPTPITPSAVQGISPGMLAIVNYDPNLDPPITSRTAVGSLKRRFNLPMELSGLSMTIGGVTCGLKSVGPHEIVFVVPQFLSSSATGTDYDLVVNSNGTVMKGKVNIVPTRPDIFNTAGALAPGGRAKLFNVTNHVHTTEPFTVTTIKIKGGVRVPSVLRLYLTGVANADPGVIAIRIGDATMAATALGVGGDLFEPGVYTVDFRLPPSLNATGDRPVVVTVNAGGTIFSSRLDDTTSFVRIL